MTEQGLCRPDDVRRVGARTTTTDPPKTTEDLNCDRRATTVASGWRAMRRRILTPSTSEADLSVRGFHEKTPEARQMLETVGRTFLTGYGLAAEARLPADAEQRLEELPWQIRGFAYEGAAMGFAIRDALPFGGNHLKGFLQGRASNHVYMVYVGVGLALARMPRIRWAKGAVAAEDPVLRWLVLDGYGFHQGYFHTDHYVRQQYREPNFPWPIGAPSGYADRVIDQGLGRAIWFVSGTDPERAADLIDAFDQARHPDLYAGVGLAATYAGGVDEHELRVLIERAGRYQPELAQGSVFAAAARYEADLVTPHTLLAADMLCGLTPQQASALAAQTRVGLSDDGAVPSYELWRHRIASEVGELRRGAS